MQNSLTIAKVPFWKRSLYLASKPYYMKRDLQEGEHDLLKLVDTEKFEGAWVFNLLTSEWYYTVAEFFNKENICQFFSRHFEHKSPN